MSREKQIEEMIDALKKCSCVYTDCEQECAQCSNEELYDDTLNHIARTLYEAGYRKQEWISVTERLPTDERNVLAYYGFDRGDGDLGMMFIGVLSYFAYDPKPHFQHEESGLRVTHWMPLPEPPKMEGCE